MYYNICGCYDPRQLAEDTETTFVVRDIRAISFICLLSTLLITPLEKIICQH